LHRSHDDARPVTKNQKKKRKKEKGSQDAHHFGLANIPPVIVAEGMNP